MTENGGFVYTERVGPDARGEALLGWLARRYRHSSRAEWRARIESGRVLVDSTTVPPQTLLRPGQLVTWRRPPWTEPDAPSGFGILLEDRDLLAVDKPAGLPTLPGGGFLERTLLHRVRSYAPDAAPLHRLGRWTSGVVLFARTPEARAELARQWAARRVGKRYRALAAGWPAGDAFTVTTPIGRVPHPLLGSVHAAGREANAPGAKPAMSRVTVIERRGDDGTFLCDVRIATGRPHQIRIHLAAAGHPLEGDPLYPAGGVPAPDCRALPGDPGYRLHAAELSFVHPQSGREVGVESTPPPELEIGVRP